MSDPDPTVRSPRRQSGDARRAARPAPASIGRYAVEGELGRGGMGVVYRARDTRLDRVVALKALPPELAADSASRERFELEARLLAALEHPHVAAIYGIEEDAGVSYLVLQHVEGETLAARLRRGRPGVAEALDLARQVASGLSAAHRRGIVHCDLKPANVMVTPDGTAKLVDFGIATRWRAGAGAEAAGTGSFDPQEVTGTPAYMSPEQAAGEAVDPRTDLWSFGCVLAECLGGVHPLAARGGDLADAPDWSALPDETPASVRELLARCLSRDREQRPDGIDRVRAELDRALAELGAPAAPAGSSTLPRWLTSFVGRERELAEVQALVASHRLVTLTGAAGCGKTRLAAEAASRLAPDFPDGTWFAALAPLADPLHVAACIAAAAGVREQPGRPPLPALIEALRTRRGLLLLDNCEHVLDEVSRIVARLLQECPGIAIVCTSREALGLPGETAWRVPSLAHPSAKRAPAAKDLADYDAVRLLVDRVREVRPGFAVDDETGPVLAAIVERLDGIPLALELAAARLRLLTPHQVLERLSDRFRLLTGGSRTALERHQTLRAALDWSYNLLSEDEKRCLCELSVFSGGFRLEEAARTCTGDEFEVLDLVTALVDKSLVQAETDARRAPRYRLLESIRQHAGMKLEDRADAAAVRDRHRDCYLDMAQAISRDVVESRDREPLGRAELEHDNMRAALEWCLASDDGAQKGLQLAAALVEFWDNVGHWSEARDWLQRVLAQPGVAAGSAPWAACAEGLARVSWWLGDHAAVRAHSVAAREAWLALGVPKQAASSLMHLAMCDHSSGNLAAAREGYVAVAAEALAARASGLRGDALLNLGVLDRDRGDFEAAEAAGREALSLAEAAHRERSMARALVLLGTLARDRGDLDAAWSLTERGLRIHESRNERHNAAAALADLGHVARLREDLPAALALYSESAARCREMQDRRGLALALANAGLVARRQGDVPGAASGLLEALGLAREMSNRPLQASITCALGFVRADEGRPAEAARLIGAATAAREEMGRVIAGAELAELQRETAALQSQLGHEAFEREWRAGADAGLAALVDSLTQPKSA